MVTAGEGSSTARPESREADLIEDFSLAVPASDFSFTGVNDDRQWKLSDFDGKVVIINFWATWCAPCRVEIPDLNRLQDKYRNDGLVILSISDEPKNLLVRWEETVPMRTYRMRVPEFIELPTPFTDSFVLRPTT
ncbi:MAG: TlpA family protein disulfide reductase, partial [Bacteroidetes bacterium]|nr:TlpA family protein disulfide reductase [Bacteroidota bacterium]